MLLANSLDQIAILTMVSVIYLAIMLTFALGMTRIRSTFFRSPIKYRVGGMEVACLLVVLATLLVGLRYYFPPSDRDFVPLGLTISGAYGIWWFVLSSRLAANETKVFNRLMFGLIVLPGWFLGPPVLALAILGCWLAPLSYHGASWSLEMVRPIEWVMIVTSVSGFLASMAIVHSSGSQRIVR